MWRVSHPGRRRPGWFMAAGFAAAIRPHCIYRVTARTVAGAAATSGGTAERPAVTDGVLSPSQLQRVAQEVTGRQGFLPLHGQGAEIRTDQIMWLNAATALEQGMPATAAAIDSFRTMITESLLSRPDVGTLLLPRRVMLSHYGPADEHREAGMYTAHRDGFVKPTWRDGVEIATEIGRTTAHNGLGAGLQSLAIASERMKPSQLNHRAWTAIMYLNPPLPSSSGGGEGEDWCLERDGGALRCFIDTSEDDSTGETAKEVLDVAPLGGRTVIFRSRDLLHSVLPTNRQRLAMTAWIFDEGILDSEELAQFVG